jgi:hypothetical protein
MSRSDPRFVWITSTREQARGLLEALAGHGDPPSFANELGGSVRDLYGQPEHTREVLQYFGIFVPSEAIPDEVVTPTEEEAQAILDELDAGDAAVPPYVGFRPPWCGGTPPSYSLTFGYIFEVVAERAAESEDSAS